jgi:hypothetical protein
VLDVRVEFLDSLQEFPCRCIAAGGYSGVEVHLDDLHHVQRLVNMA